MDNSFYTEEELKSIGFKSCGKNVLISKKSSIYGVSNITIGSNVRIDDFCILSGTIAIGNYIHISAYSALYGGICGIVLEDFVTISARVLVYAKSDDYSGDFMSNPLLPEEYTNVESQPVIMKKHTIIGAGSVVLPGVILQEGSSFGAMSLITKSSNPWSINVGIPSKQIKNRKKNIIKLEEQFIESDIYKLTNKE